MASKFWSNNKINATANLTGSVHRPYYDKDGYVLCITFWAIANPSSIY